MSMNKVIDRRLNFYSLDQKIPNFKFKIRDIVIIEKWKDYDFWKR